MEDQNKPDEQILPSGDNIHTYTLAEGPEAGTNKQKFLLKDGRMVFCHKMPPAIDMPKVQSLNAQAKIVPMMCNLDCGKATVYKLPDGSFEYEQACDLAIIRFRLLVAEQKASQDQKNKMSLVK